MKFKYIAIGFVSLLTLGMTFLFALKKIHTGTRFSIGQKLDSLNGVYVYFNGSTGHVKGRNTTADGYNLGLKYQCVEFVKRYYYQHLHHKMPNSYGNAKDYFNRELKDGEKNQKRGLIQYNNPGISKPKVDDLLILDGTKSNPYGHVAIVSKVTNDEIEIVQQNPGNFGNSRATFDLKQETGKWHIDNARILGWLRKEAGK